MSDPEQSAAALRERIQKLSPGTIEKPTLVYFDIIGIAWPIRVMLHLSEVDYELIQISILEWSQTDQQGNPMLKPCFTNGHVPLYVDSDVELNQSALIIEYLADRYGFMDGEGPSRTAALEVMAHAYDSLFHWNGMLPVNIRLGMSDDEAHRRLDAFMGKGVYGLSSNGYRQNLDAFDRYLAKSSGDYLVGDNLTVADLHSFNALRNWYKAFAPEVFRSEYPQLDEFVQRVEAMPGIRDYMDKHQEPTTWFNWPKAALRLTSESELDAIRL